MRMGGWRNTQGSPVWLLWAAVAVGVAIGCTVVLGAAAVSTVRTAGPAAKGCPPRWRVVAEGRGVPDFYDVAALSATDVWAVGARGGLHGGSVPVAAHWDGRQLVITKPFTSSSGHGELGAVAVVARDDVWAVGTDGLGLGRPIVVHWNGRSWKVAKTPSFPSEGALSDIVAFDADDVWAVGQLDTPSQPPILMRWNGSRWRIVDLGGAAPRGSSLNGIDGTSSRDVWAVGDKYPLQFPHGSQPLLLHWNGHAWTEPIPPSAAVNDESSTGGAIDVRSAGDVWAILNGSEDGSYDIVARWIRSARGKVAFRYNSDGGLNDIAAVSLTSVWVAGYAYPEGYDYDRPHPLLVHWDGRSWRVQQTSLDAYRVELSGISALSPSDIWVAGGRPITSNGTLRTGFLARYSC